MGLGCECRIGQGPCREAGPHAWVEPPGIRSNVKFDGSPAATGADTGAAEEPAAKHRAPCDKLLRPAFGQETASARLRAPNVATNHQSRRPSPCGPQSGVSTTRHTAIGASRTGIHAHNAHCIRHSEHCWNSTTATSSLAPRKSGPATCCHRVA